MTELVVLLIVMIIGAVVALEIKDLLSSVVIIGALGLCLSVGFVLLKAPDLAMVQLVVELILMVILIRATVIEDKHDNNKKRENAYFFVVISSLVVFLSAAFFIIRKLPIFGKPIFRISYAYLKDLNINALGSNILASLMLDWRVFDVFGCMIALFVAVICVLLLVKGKRKI
ncbi:MAG: DUF4040 domain-containing protein [Candidatus Omnitrophica bacterium]|nr:DUF4040 domain-containing protein [Candidatus Omnitrophota bacterium]